MDEEEAGDLVYEVYSPALGKDQPATAMSERGVAFYFPKVTYSSHEIPLPKSLNIELVKGFDESSVDYIL